MKILDVLKKESIISDLKAMDKRGVLEEMVGDVAIKSAGLDKERLLEILLEREKLGSTGIGYGVAIPHGKLKNLDCVVVTFGRSVTGIDYQSLDNKPAHLFFLILAPEDSTAAHLKILARISKLLKDPSFRKKLLSAPSSDEIFNAIAEEEGKLN
jgi:PTS system nitrogen regulatory IIA component